MKSFFKQPVQAAVSYISIGLLATSSFAFGQEQANGQAATPDSQQQQASNPTGGWRRVGDPAPAQDTSSQDPTYNQAQNYNQAPNYGTDQSDPNQPVAPPSPSGSYGPAPANPYSGQPAYQQPNPPQQNYPQQNPPQQPNYSGQQNYPAPPPVPSALTIPEGTFITVRVNQLLSSDRNQAGDAFSATLQEPIVVNGVVVAEPGQTIGGRVVEAQKAGRVEGVARLGVQLTSLTLVDGQQLPIQTQLISRKGDTSVGRDVGAVAGTTALGAAIGAAAGWGRGAAIGAGAGLLVGTLGVLVTRGQPSVIYPEQVLTFRLQAPVTLTTTNSPQAFRYVQPGEYDRPSYANGPVPGAYMAATAPPFYGYAAAYPYPYYRYGYGYPYYWGPSFAFAFGPGYFWGGGRYYSRPFYRGGIIVRGAVRR
jgi:hypothetical protein